MKNYRVRKQPPPVESHNPTTTTVIYYPDFKAQLSRTSAKYQKEKSQTETN